MDATACKYCGFVASRGGDEDCPASPVTRKVDMRVALKDAILCLRACSDAFNRKGMTDARFMAADAEARAQKALDESP